MDAEALLGSEPGIAFPGLDVVVARLHRWRHAAPFMLRNGLAWREDTLAAPDLDDAKRAWIAAERELYAQAIAGTLPPPEAFRA